MTPIGDAWHDRVPAAFWRDLFHGAEGGWRDYAETTVPSMRARDAADAVRQKVVDPALREAGIDAHRWYPVPNHPEPDDVLRALLPALGRRPMAEFLTGGKLPGAKGL
ncbi:hypothetical protein ACVIGB_000957 [Bradyrhizobium sp. USDA 4341]